MELWQALLGTLLLSGLLYAERMGKIRFTFRAKLYVFLGLFLFVGFLCNAVGILPD